MEKNSFTVTYAFSPKSYEDVKHKEVPVQDIEKIANILGWGWFNDNENFVGKTAEEILSEASKKNRFLIGIQTMVPENFNSITITPEDKAEIEEILNLYTEQFEIKSPINIFLG